jgi:hypothetical protein
VRTGIGAGAVGLVAVACCAGLPLLAAAGLSAAAYALAGGIAGGAIALAVLIALLARVRRARSCAAPTTGESRRRS